jgi:ferritin
VAVMLAKKVAKLINEQVTLEFYSAYLYLDMANYYADQGLEGFAHWFEIQTQEERDHAMLMRTYLLNNDVHVVFGTIDKPDKVYKKLEDPLNAALEHEQFITGCINKIYSAAADEKDYRTMQCFDWFVKEQGEEEKNVGNLIKKFKLFGSDPKGLYALDQELLARVYTAPSLVL